MIDLTEKYKEIETHWQEVGEELSLPETVRDREKFKRLARSHKELTEVVEAFRSRTKLAEQVSQAREMRGDSDPEMAEMAAAEFAQASADLEKADLKIQVLLLPKDPRDAKDVIMEIRAGTGGDEAGLFAGDLFRMYNLFAESQGWKTELISSSPTDLGGFKEVVFSIAGGKVFSKLKYESGTHRVQRVPTTETQGRVHTSAVTVAVLPEAEEVDIEIRSEDIKIDVFRSSGPGGQSVNTTDSAVRITHVPTGLVVSQQDEKSQIKNKAKALKVLRARLYDLELSKLDAERSADRRSQVGTGDRSGRIRTYNFPQNRLTDHRINLTLYSLDRVITGQLTEVVDAVVTFHQAEALKSI